MESGPLLPDDETSIAGTRDWPHAPPHRLQNAGVFFVTSRSIGGQHLLAEDDMKDWFQDRLFGLASDYGWKLEAWAILSNHYHLIGHSPPAGGRTLKQVVTALHSLATKERNRRDGTLGRTRLWHNYRETALTHQRSYLARLHYVHQNAVHHGLVRLGSNWKWCSAAAFKKAASPAWVKTISSFAYDEIAERDGDNR